MQPADLRGRRLDIEASFDRLVGFNQEEIRNASIALISSAGSLRKLSFTGALGESRDTKCTVAGGIAGATAGTLVGGACFLLFKKKMCGTAGTSVGKYVSGWIADKCNGAQNT